MLVSDVTRGEELVRPLGSSPASTRVVSRRPRKEGLGAEDALDAVQEAFQTFLLLPQARLLVELVCLGPSRASWPCSFARAG
jgi:hypothetical protein